MAYLIVPLVGPAGGDPLKEPIMGNPAGMRRKKSEKRRAKFEKRLGVLAYMPKEQQVEVKAAMAAAAAKK